MRRVLTCVVGLIVAAALLAPGAAAQAPSPFTALSDSAVYDPATGLVTFTLVFNRAPDFQSSDAFGRQADSFQYFIYGDLSLPYPAYYDAIIRGEELHVFSGGLRVRNSTPPDPDPAAGGWGSIRGVVPYRLEGNVLTFSVSLSTISDHSSDGRFSYSLQLYQYGGLTQSFERESVVRPPLPTSKDQCKDGGWQTYGVFKNRGDCVSFVATGGKNPPGATSG
jgi:hypothetical protein